MFFRDKKERRLAMLAGISFTSKAALKQQCILAYQGNIKEAKEAYDFLIDGIENLPDVDPIQPTMTEQAKDIANGIIGWLGNNQQTLVSTYQTVRDMFAGRAVEEAAAMLDRFVTEMLQEGRVVTAPKVMEAVANWKGNALVKNRIMNHFPRLKR